MRLQGPAVKAAAVGAALRSDLIAGGVAIGAVASFRSEENRLFERFAVAGHEGGFPFFLEPAYPPPTETEWEYSDDGADFQLSTTTQTS